VRRPRIAHSFALLLFLSAVDADSTAFRMASARADGPSGGVTADPAVPDPSNAVSHPTDEVICRDGSRLIGEIVSLVDGVLEFRLSGTTDPVHIRWSQVTALRSKRDRRFVLRSGSEHSGAVEPGSPGSIVVRADDTVGGVTLPLRRVTAIDPPAPDWTLEGSFEIGAAVRDGTSRTKSASAFASFEAKNRIHAFELHGRWNHAQSAASGLTARDVSGDARYEIRVLDRVGLFTEGSAETDVFRDLDLRSILSVGSAYHFVEPGDHPEEWLEGVRWLDELDIRGDLGLGWIHTDFESGGTEDTISARWSASVDWPVLPGVTIFHVHDGYPSLEDLDDLYITSRQGVRFLLPAGFQISAHLHWDWDNTPSPGFDRSDILYVLAVGYSMTF
jgi:hypothetical protein